MHLFHSSRCPGRLLAVVLLGAAMHPLPRLRRPTRGCPAKMIQGDWRAHCKVRLRQHHCGIRSLRQGQGTARVTSASVGSCDQVNARGNPRKACNLHVRTLVAPSLGARGAQAHQLSLRYWTVSGLQQWSGCPRWSGRKLGVVQGFVGSTVQGDPDELRIQRNSANERSSCFSIEMVAQGMNQARPPPACLVAVGAAGLGGVKLQYCASVCVRMLI